MKLEAVVTVGCSASGKSTFAEEFTSKNDNWVELNRDNIRFNGKPKDWSLYKFNKRNENEVTVKWDNQLQQAVDNKKNVVCSDTNLNPFYLGKLASKLEKFGYDVEIKYFDVEFEELLKRDNNRVGGVGYEVLLKQYINYQRNVKGVKVYTGTPDKQKTYIFDIDGTLAKNVSRSPYDFSKVDEDVLIDHVSNVAYALHATGHKIIFLSGRSSECSDDSRKWLTDNLGEWTEDCFLFMREVSDTRKDYVVKMELFDRYIRNNYDVIGVFDDRKQVIECCWRVLGINTFNVGNPEERF